MSAPWEVFLGIDEWMDSEDRHLPTDIRYLRADLTCGECAYYGQTSDTWTDGDCGKRERYAYAADPACMAFQPRKETP